MRDFLPYKRVVYEIIGAAMEVHKVLGGGLLEHVYNESLCLELMDRGIICERERRLPCYYKQHKLERYYQIDLMVENIIVEIKSVNEMAPVHRSQLFNYMRLTKMPIGILINFGQKSLQGERYAFIPDTNECLLLDRNMKPVMMNILENYGD